MKKSLIALAFGTLGLGIAEFTMMGILPYVAQDLGVSIPTAGHFISAYALGVCAGAPLLILARKCALKRILLALVALMLIGNLCASLASGYWMLLAARFVSGLPHGAYFGVASIVAGKLADKGKSSEAVSIMIAGMTVANLFGVPLGTSLSHTLSWRVTFLLVAGWAVITFYYIHRWVPVVEGLADTGFKGQFRFLKKPAPWLILGATALGNGGVFCWYSYVNPMLTEVSGFSANSMTALMVLAGFGMVAGNLASGRLSDRYSPYTLLRLSMVLMLVGLSFLLIMRLGYIILGLGILTFAFFSTHTMASRIVSMRANEARSSATSLYWLFYYAGSSLLGSATGVWLSDYGWEGFVAALSVLVGVAFVVSCVALPMYRITLKPMKHRI